MSRSIKSSSELKELTGYELVKEELIQELSSVGLLFSHKKTGARVVILSNDDDNKVFSIGFRTPPKNSTGVAHIVEHSVLCGSRKFPSKDPFVELVKGSLNTFLNAMTYPDKTLYPIASCNEKDFQNLMDVYMDAVLYPNIYKKPEIFWQEGWHYELLNKEDPIIYNGVVYNEMKGAFSSPEQVLNRLVQQVLFPDTAYGTESGGDPDDIPNLSYEEFIEFHRSYYHPSNAYIYLYGNLDIEEKLEWLDTEYLSNFEKAPVDSHIHMQKPFAKIKEVSKEYGIAADENPLNKTYFNYNTVIGTSIDKELYLAFQIIDYVLAGAPGAPLKKALLDAGIGKDITTSYDNGILQPIFSITAKNTNEDRKEEFVQIIETTLKQLVRNGIDEKALEAAIHFNEFRYKEADFGQYPKGLMYGLQIFDTWLYNDELPFLHIKADETYEFLKKQVGTGYYERLIEENLLYNNHKALIIVKPSAGLSQKHEQEITKKLASYKQSLSESSIESLIAENSRLRTFQETPSTIEELERIPLLGIQDIEKEAPDLYNTEKTISGIKTLHHNIFTNGIGYLKLLFDVSSVPAEQVSYIGLLSSVLGAVDTENYSYLQLSNQINIHTGGLYTDTNVYGRKGSQHVCQPKFEIRAKAFYSKYDMVYNLLGEMIFHTKLEDDRRLLEIISEIRSRIEARLSSSGHTNAIGRCFTYHSANAAYDSFLSGRDYYEFIAELEDNFESRKVELKQILKNLMKGIFCRENLLISFTGDEEGYDRCLKEMSDFSNKLYQGQEAERQMEILPIQKNEGFKYSGNVQYVARTGNFIEAGYEYTGALKVLKVILGYDYLWQNVRVKGGAYGCSCGFTREGNAYFVSYRDPNLRETNEVYKNISGYLNSIQIGDRDMTKYIIGAISNMDTPLTPNNKGLRSLNAYLTDITMEDIQTDRDEVLTTDPKAIRECAAICDSVLAQGNICVIGNEDKVEECKDLFLTITNLMK